MADNKKAEDQVAPKQEDTKSEINQTCSPELVAGADAHLEDVRGRVFGDTTSSSAAANTPGQHGRDGGTINGEDNNPAPSDEAISGEGADASSTGSEEFQTPELSTDKADANDKLGVKKL